MSQVIQAHRERVGRQIRRARKHAGLSHDALAVRVGSSRQHLIKLEKGMHLPSDALLGRIAEATGKTVSYFESEEDDEESDPLGAMTLDDFLRVRLRALLTEMVANERGELGLFVFFGVAKEVLVKLPFQLRMWLRRGRRRNLILAYTRQVSV